MSTEKQYLEALAKRAREILEEQEEPKSKPKGKKAMDDETKARVLENLKKGREKAAEIRNMKKQIKEKEKEEKVKEFEELKAKYNITTSKPKEQKQEPPRRQRAEVPAYKEENDTEINKDLLGEKKEEVKVQSEPIDIPKVKEEEKPIEIIQNSVPSVPTIQKPRYFKPTLGFVRKYGSLYA